ncbi:MAG TPA: tRNA (adenine-N1)-methyltransferase [Thermoplasmata archaeon]
MIAEGDRVLLQGADGRKHLIRAKGEMMDVRGLGVVDGSVIRAASYGDTMSIGGHKFVILRPSISDTISLLERKAQMMIPKDSYALPMYLDVSTGSRVIEGGAGSGAMTIVLLKSVFPTGAVYSYETREDHASIAKRNIEMSGLDSCWHLKMADICNANLEKDVDAVLLDIPNPWDAVDNAVGALKAGGYLCCYVPNTNQLNDTVKKMREAGLSEILSFENLQREMVVHDGGVRPSFDMLGHTGYIAIGRKVPRQV